MGGFLLKEIEDGWNPPDQGSVDYYKGRTSDAWRQDKLHLRINLPDPLQNSWFLIENYAPFVTINAIYNQGEAINAGWAVDMFGLDMIGNYKIYNTVPIWADIAVRDSDGILYRVGYNVTLSGRITEPPRPS